jgi:hypothetical protein
MPAGRGSRVARLTPTHARRKPNVVRSDESARRVLLCARTPPPPPSLARALCPCAMRRGSSLSSSTILPDDATSCLWRLARVRCGGAISERNGTQATVGEDDAQAGDGSSLVAERLDPYATRTSFRTSERNDARATTAPQWSSDEVIRTRQTRRISNLPYATDTSYFEPRRG